MAAGGQSGQLVVKDALQDGYGRACSGRRTGALIVSTVPQARAHGAVWVAVPAVGGRRFTALNVGGSINNGLHIGRPVGATSPRLLVCNNDATIKVLALPSLERVTDLVLPAPVNYGARTRPTSTPRAAREARGVLMPRRDARALNPT